MLNSEGKLFALFLCDIKGNRIDNDDRFALFVGISQGVPGTAGASIPYCENIIGVIDHVPISLVHAVRRVLPLQHGFLVTLCRDIIIPSREATDHLIACVSQGIALSRVM